MEMLAGESQPLATSQLEEQLDPWGDTCEPKDEEELEAEPAGDGWPLNVDW